MPPRHPPRSPAGPAGNPGDAAPEESRTGTVPVGEPGNLTSPMPQGEPASDEQKRADDSERARMERAARYLKGPTAFSA
ncbi:hypothetical protein [Microvirga sp. 2TAF3]|uniref:hypothetical protein n=1 Tax=Microvirga sp. 2TAF3 TaxID=3233014 RepID=UPI003F9B23B9